MPKGRKTKILIAIGAGAGALTLGAAVAITKTRLPLEVPWQQGTGGAQSPQISAALNLNQVTDSVVLPLVGRAPKERSGQLEAIAQGPKSLDQFRARYLLAADLIQQGRGGAALPWLKSLDQDYPVLAPPVLAKRAQAYIASSNPTQAEATWKELLQRYPESPETAEALFAFGKTNAQYWDQAIAQFPAHPCTIAIAQARLRQNPNQPQLLLLLARHGVYLTEIESILDRLTREYSAQLKPEDWEAIAFAYWENGRYNSAGLAYGKAPHTPLNLYRAGRGAQLGERTTNAISAYIQLIQAFPDAKETGLALMRLSKLATSRQTALTYLDQVISRFPDRAGEALLARSEILDELQSSQSASQARQSVLNQYSKSDAAAELRWKLAEQRFKKQDIRGAWDLARQIVSENPSSEYAAKAAFWVGKWALALQQEGEAKTAFEYVLTHYPESYYAWRSAVHLGWNVGDFTTVRQQTPQVIKPSQRPLPPAGSETLQELYRLGQDRDAWALWQVEFQNLAQPTVAQQFTDGLMRLGIGDNLDGIYMISSLSNREQSEEQSDYQTLKQQVGYWQALYPFPFLQPIETWSQQRQLNPVLVTALIRQESRFEPAIRSSAGATGLMQVMPGTADWVAQQLNLSEYRLDNPDDNIKLGTWYLNYTHQEYDDNSLFAVASYNAGPGNVADWISRFSFNDPDVFVEQIPFLETKGYVEAVFENYWNYLRLYNPDVSQQLAQYSPNHAEVVSVLSK